VSIFEQVDMHELFSELGLLTPISNDPNQLLINY
jgi:hypothetical protein